jgi:hypothetical protein
MDDEVADLEIAQVGEERLGRRAPPFGGAAFFLEDVGLGVNLETGVRQAEAARQRADSARSTGTAKTS